MSNPILDYIFVRKGGIRAKTPAEAFLAAYLITATANKKRLKDTNQTDTKRGESAIKEFYSKKLTNQNTKKIRKILESFKKKLKSELKNDKDDSLTKSKSEFIKLFAYNDTGLKDKPSDYSTTYSNNLSISKEDVKNEFRPVCYLTYFRPFLSMKTLIFTRLWTLPVKLAEIFMISFSSVRII